MHEGQDRPDEGEFADLERLFEARGIALVGASKHLDKIGGRPLRYLDRVGYRGEIHPVNPKYDEILGRPCAPSVAGIDGVVDLALIAVPGGAVDAAVDDCLAAGVPYAVVFSSGFAEVGPEGRARQERLVERARAGGLRLLGPNSLGAASSSNDLIASFATLFDRHEEMLPGRVGFISQSGALGVFIYAIAQDQGVGFSRFASIGNEGDLDVADFLAYLARDPQTTVIGGYLESVKDGERFLAAAELARAAGKPMAFLKVGRSEAGRRAAESHTGSLAGADAVYDAALRQAGIVRAADPQGLIDFLGYHARPGATPARPGVAILTISGGAGVWSADRLADLGVELADLAPETVARLTEILPAFASPRNPVDPTGQILNQPELFEACLDAMLDDPGVATLVVVLGLQERGGGALADQLVRVAQERPDRSIAVAWLAAPAGVAARLAGEGIPVYDDLARCIDAVGGSVRSGRLLAGAPARARADRAPDAPDLADAGVEHGAKRLIAELGVPVPAGALCADREAAVAAAAEVGAPVVLKGQVRGVAHKTEHGLVRLGVFGPDEVGAAYDDLVAAMEAAAGGDAIDGVLVEAMAPPGVEVIVGCVRDPVFGPTVMFGLGGVLVEVVEDVAFRVAPIDEAAALAMIDETRGARVLDGVRGGPPLDKRAVARVLSAVSQLAAAHPASIREIEINPLRVYEEGTLALDALVLTDGAPARARAEV